MHQSTSQKEWSIVNGRYRILFQSGESSSACRNRYRTLSRDSDMQASEYLGVEGQCACPASMQEFGHCANTPLKKNHSSSLDDSISSYFTSQTSFLASPKNPKLTERVQNLGGADSRPEKNEGGGATPLFHSILLGAP